MEKYSSGRHVAVIENCVMTRVGLQHLFIHGVQPACQLHMFKTGQEWATCSSHPSYEAVIYSVAESRLSRQQCMGFLTHLKKTQPNAARVLLAKDEHQARVIHHLSAVSLHAVFCKSSALPKLALQLKSLLSQCHSSGLSRPELKSCEKNLTLSPTEGKILDYMGKGLSVPDIARKMERNAKTIRSHKFNVMTKLGVHNDSELLCAADVLRSPPLQLKPASGGGVRQRQTSIQTASVNSASRWGERRTALCVAPAAGSTSWKSFREMSQ